MPHLPSSAGKGEIMGRLVTASASVLAFVLSGLMVNAAMAQDKAKADKAAPKATIKVVAENDKVRAFETTYAPGAENTAVPRSSIRVVRALKGGTLQRTYADGKKENVVYKAGDVRINQPGPNYTTKNVGKTEIRLDVVQLKEAASPPWRQFLPRRNLARSFSSTRVKSRARSVLSVIPPFWPCCVMATE